MEHAAGGEAAKAGYSLKIGAKNIDCKFRSCVLSYS